MTPEEKRAAVAEMKAKGISVDPAEGGGFMINGFQGMSGWARTQKEAWAMAWNYFSKTPQDVDFILQ